MKGALTSLRTLPHAKRILEWSKLLVLTGSAQIAVQGLGFLSGILIIRLLPQEEYAYYTMANGLLGMLTVLADGGISTGVMAQGGRVWQDREKLGEVLATGIALRKRFALVALAISTPILLYLLHKQEASTLMCGIIALSLLPTFFTSLTGRILEIAPRLHQLVGPIQSIQIISGVLRLGLSTLFLFLFPFAAVAILCAGLPQLYVNRRLRGISTTLANTNSGEDAQSRREILKVVRRILPAAVYYAFSAQITIWIISIFGKTQSIAEIGALGRLSQLLTVFSSVIGILLLPRLARASAVKRSVLKHFLVIVGTTIGFGCAVLLASAMFPTPFLLLLGPAYSNLSQELLLSLGGACIGLVGGAIFSANASRGWIVLPWFEISISLSVQVALVAIMDFTTTKGALYMGVSLALSNVIMHGMNFLYYFRKMPSEPIQMEL